MAILYNKGMKAALREEAVRLRLDNQMSYGEIKKRLGVSKGTLSRWLEDLPLSPERMLELRRNGWSKGEAKREKFRETMRAKRDARDAEVYIRQKQRLSLVSEESLFVAGLMLYAAEGEKKSRCDIAFTNTDPALVRFFARWIVQFLGLPKEKLRIQLHLYENMDIKVEEQFWLTELSFSEMQLWKSQVHKLRPNSFSYRDTSRHGTCKLYIGNTIKKSEIRLSIKAFFDTHEERARSSVGRALR